MKKILYTLLILFIFFSIDKFVGLFPTNGIDQYSNLNSDIKSLPYDLISEFKYYSSNPQYFSSLTNILLVGDPFRGNFDFSNKDSISYLLESKLRLKNTQIRVHNAGASASNSVDNYFILNKILENHKPSIIIYFYSSNDMDFTEFNLSKNLACSQYNSNSSLSLYSLSKYSNILKYLYKNFANLVHNISDHKSDLSCSLEYLKKSKKIMDSTPHFFINRDISPYNFSKCSDGSKKPLKNDLFLQNQLGVESYFIDTVVASRGCKDFYNNFSSDDYHYSKAGNKIIAAYLYDIIRSNEIFSKVLLNDKRAMQ